MKLFKLGGLLLRAGRSVLVVVFVCPPFGLAQAQSTILGTQGNITLRVVEEVPLSENIELIGFVSDGTITDDGDLILTDRSNGTILKYNQQGQQITQIGHFGAGPFEYEQPDHIHAYGDTLIVWDQANRKFIFYNTEGTPIHEVTNFEDTVEGFAYSQGKLLIHLGSRLRAHQMAIFDIDRDVYVRTFAVRSIADDMFIRWAFSGVVGVRDSNFFYVRPSSLLLHRVNAQTYDTTSYPIHDTDFKIERARKTYRESNSAEKRTFFQENSRVSGLFVLDNYYIVQTENGKWVKLEEGDDETYMEGTAALSGRDRHFNLIFLDEDFNQIDTIKLDYSERKALGAYYYGIWFGKGNRLYILNNQTDESGENVRWILKVLEVEE